MGDYLQDDDELNSELMALQAAQPEDVPEAPTLPQEPLPAEPAPVAPPPVRAPQGAPPAPQTEDEILRAGLLGVQARAKAQRDELSQTEDRAAQQTGFTRIAQAGANLGNSIAGGQPLNQAPFEALATDAQAPLKALERRSAIATNQDKILRDYMVKQALVKAADNRLDKRLATTEKVAGNRDARIASEGELNRASREKVAGQRLSLIQAGLNLRQSGQAMQLVSKYNQDPVMKVASTQLQSLDKGLGRLKDIASGRVPFTTTMLSELQQDFLGALTGSNSGALGKLERIEYTPVAAKIQKFVDNMKGYQGDINDPEYHKQLTEQFSGLKQDILRIQANRGKRLESQYGAATSGNPKAAAALKATGEALEQPAPEGQAPVPPGKVRVKNLETGKTGFIDEAKVEAAVNSKKFERVQ